MAGGEDPTVTGAGDKGKDVSSSEPVKEVVIRTVRETSSRDWLQLTRTNYGEWVVLMKWRLKAMDALLSSTPLEFHEAIGNKQMAKEAWDMLASFCVGSDLAKRAKAQ